jgi:hypothetical protein
VGYGFCTDILTPDNTYRYLLDRKILPVPYVSSLFLSFFSSLHRPSFMLAINTLFVKQKIYFSLGSGGGADQASHEDHCGDGGEWCGPHAQEQQVRPSYFACGPQR